MEENNSYFSEDMGPIYSYKNRMFMITVSVVIIHDNTVLLIKDGDLYKFPSGCVKAGAETIQFAAIRYVKEQSGIKLSKDVLLPVDFRSDPERSKSGNVVDVGMLCLLNQMDSYCMKSLCKMCLINFDECKLEEDIKLVGDSNILLKRSIELATIFS